MTPAAASLKRPMSAWVTTHKTVSLESPFKLAFPLLYALAPLKPCPFVRVRSK